MDKFKKEKGQVSVWQHVWQHYLLRNNIVGFIVMNLIDAYNEFLSKCSSYVLAFIVILPNLPLISM